MTIKKKNLKRKSKEKVNCCSKIEPKKFSLGYLALKVKSIFSKKRKL
jgi:hypothetical protein